MKKKKRTGLVITLVVILLILAAGGFVAYTMYANAMAEKEAVYVQAEEYLSAGNYRDAYRTYLQVEDYKDSAEKANSTLQMMESTAKTHIYLAQHFSDLNFNTVAGLYLTEVLKNEKQFTLDDYNEMADMIGGFYELATKQYTENMEIEDKDLMTLPVMEKLMPRIEALEAGSDPMEALDVISEITTFSLADQVFLHCWNNGIFDGTSLDTMAQICPVWVPAMDQVIASDENLDILELVSRT